MEREPLEVEIWADVVCPWCYIGKARFDEALAGFPHRDAVRVTLRSFELDPTPREAEKADTATRLASKYGVPLEQARGMIDNVRGVAAQAGLPMAEGEQFHGNTRDAHRLLCFAQEQGRGLELSDALYAAHFVHGDSVFDPESLAAIAVSVGLDEAKVRAVLASDAYASNVIDDESTAADLGITGVPFFVFDRRFGVSGAQPVEVLAQALDEAWVAQGA